MRAVPRATVRRAARRAGRRRRPPPRRRSRRPAPARRRATRPGPLVRSLPRPPGRRWRAPGGTAPPPPRWRCSGVLGRLRAPTSGTPGRGLRRASSAVTARPARRRRAPADRRARGGSSGAPERQSLVGHTLVEPVVEAEVTRPRARRAAARAASPTSACGGRSASSASTSTSSAGRRSAPARGGMALQIPDDELVPRMAEAVPRPARLHRAGRVADQGRAHHPQHHQGLPHVDLRDLWLPFFCVSTNLTRSHVEVHDRGDAATAIRASVAIPGVLPPVPFDGDLLVDGGVLNNLPCDVMRASGMADRVIAVDLSRRSDRGPRTTSGCPSPGGRRCAPSSPAASPGSPG